MPAVEIAYCPQCILFVFAAMGVYQYVVRDRIRNGLADENDEWLDLAIEKMDEATQLMLLEMLAADHKLETATVACQPNKRRSSSQPTAA